MDEELHVYIAAMQLFPIKLNFSFIKNADVKVRRTPSLLWTCTSLMSLLSLAQAFNYRGQQYHSHLGEQTTAVCEARDTG